MKRTLAAIWFGPLLFSLSVAAQSPMATTIPAGDFQARPEVGDEQGFRRAGYPRPSEPRVIKDGPLAPSLSDRTAFSSFLKEKDTGLIRLLPRELLECKTNPAAKLFFTQGGPYFSFAHRTHLYGHGSDIQLQQNHLSVGFAGADFGMMTNAGDVPLSELTADDPRVQQLNAYRPPKPEAEARSEYRRSNSPEGMTFDGFVYRKRAPVAENSTYLLRSISYGRSDVLVGFRLARQDPDGSVIIAWKLLKRYPVTQLKHNK